MVISKAAIQRDKETHGESGNLQHTESFGQTRTRILFQQQLERCNVIFFSCTQAEQTSFIQTNVLKRCRIEQLLTTCGKKSNRLLLVFIKHVFPVLPSQLTQGLEYYALKNDQVLGLLQVGLRLRDRHVTH